MMVAQIASDQAPETLRLAGEGWELTSVPLDSIRAVATRGFMLRASEQERAELEALRKAPPTGQDRVMVTKSGRRQAIDCTVERIGDEGADIALEGRRLPIRWEGVEWIVLAQAEPPARDPANAHRIELRDGTTLAVDSFELAGGRLEGKRGSARCRVEAGQLSRMRLAPRSYRYLSDVQPEGVETQPFIDVVWPPRLDRAVTGGPLALDGKEYPKGIGMHARTAMTFAVDGRFSRFYARVGVDDAAGRHGCVRFRIFRDGETAWESEPMSGAEPAQEVAVEIGGARRLTLAADFGSPVEAGGNLADWAEARVVR